MMIHGLILLKFGEHEAYAKHCGVMLDRYENTDHRAALSSAAKTLFIDPQCDNPDLVSRAVAAARKAKAIEPENAWALLCAGLAEFRTGDHLQAINLLEKIETDQPSCRSAALAIRALATSAQGDSESAKHLLEKTQDALTDLDPNWFNQWIAEMLVEEAKALIASE